METYYTYRLFCHMAMMSEGVGFFFIGNHVYLTPMYINSEFRRPGVFAAKVRADLQLESEFFMAQRAMLDANLGEEGLGEGDSILGYELAALAEQAGLLDAEDVAAVGLSISPSERAAVEEWVA